MNSPRVGIVIVNYNGMAFLPECLESVARQTYKSFVPVVVDNMSSDGSRQWIESLPDSVEKLPLPTNTGITGGNNAGMRRCQEIGCGAIFLLNPDTVLDPDALAQLVSAMDDRTMVVPRSYCYHEPQKQNTCFGDFDFVRGISLQRFFGQDDSFYSGQPCTGTMASSCALMIPVSLAQDVGPMDERFFMYFDDTDFVARAIRMGYQLSYVPQAKLLHRESASSGGDTLGPLPLYYQTRNRLFFMVKHRSSLPKLWAFFGYFWITRLVYLARWTLRGDRRSLRAFRAAISDYRSGNLGYTPPSRFAMEP